MESKRVNLKAKKEFLKDAHKSITLPPRLIAMPVVIDDRLVSQASLCLFLNTSTVILLQKVSGSARGFTAFREDTQSCKAVLCYNSSWSQ